LMFYSYINKKANYLQHVHYNNKSKKN